MTDSDAHERYRIYMLSDPDSPEVIRYVGKTAGNIRRRLNDHVLRSRHGRNHRECWIRSLIVRGCKPVITIIDSALSEAELNQLERLYIIVLRMLGTDLVNATDGGDGSSGFKHSREARAAMSKTRTCRRHTPETRRRISENQRGRSVAPLALAALIRWTEKHGSWNRGRKASTAARANISAAARLRPATSLETRAKIRALHIGRKRTNEQRARISASLLGRRFSAEHRAHMSAARKGKPWTQRQRDSRSATVEKGGRLDYE